MSQDIFRSRETWDLRGRCSSVHVWWREYQQVVVVVFLHSPNLNFACVRLEKLRDRGLVQRNWQMRWHCLAWPRNMIYYFLFAAIAAGAAYVWATKRFGRFTPISSWRNAFNQNWALYRRRLLKRSRSQTPLAVSTTITKIKTDSVGDQVPLILSDRLEIADLRSVTTSTPNVVVATTPLSNSDQQYHQRGASNLSSVGVRHLKNVWWWSGQPF